MGGGGVLDITKTDLLRLTCELCVDIVTDSIYMKIHTKVLM